MLLRGTGWLLGALVLVPWVPALAGGTDASAQPAPREQPGKSPSGIVKIRDLEQRLGALEGTGDIAAGAEALRRDVTRLLAAAEGHEVAERGLALLLRLPPRGARPAAPTFPFDAAAARAYQKAYADRRGLPVEFTTDLEITFVLVPPGTFLMGSPADEPGRGSGGQEERRHEVTLTRAFYLARHETTVGQFRRFVAQSRHVTDVEKNGGGHAHDDRAVWKHRPGTSWLRPGYAGAFELRENHPVVHVSHADSRAFCRWLDKRTGVAGAGFRHDLPTEAQWEWACRSGSGARFWWGPDEDTTGKVANVGDRALKRVHPDWPRPIMAMDDGHAFAAPVGSYRANGFGLHDMLGNVWEFCATRHGPYPRGPVTDPGDLGTKESFAVRGGGWSNVAADVRCATRNSDPPHFGHSNLGFRVALMLPP